MPYKPDRRIPVYQRLSSTARAERIENLHRLMASCDFCPRRCRVNRLKGEAGRCGASADLVISSAGPHFGEEKELVGPGGSGTIFFTNCNLECVFCQNWTISRGVESGQKITFAELAAIMVGLQKQGCSNINLVSPTPYLYQITAAIDLAAAGGLNLPVVYNCGGYESVESLQMIEGFIDIYMPDAKYGSDASGEIYSGVGDYYSRLQDTLKEMQRQVGDLKLGSDGMAHQGLLIRHLVMPEDLAASEIVANFIRKEVSVNCAVNVMAQYHPDYRAGEFSSIDRRVTTTEYFDARELFRKAGLRLL